MDTYTLIPRYARIGFAFGLTLLSVTFPFYESWNPVVLDRWSPSWTGIIVATWVLTVSAILWAMRSVPSGRKVSWGPTSLIVVAIALWSTAYATEFWMRGESRLAAAWSRGHPFYAVTTGGVIAEWVVLALLFFAATSFGMNTVFRLTAGRVRLRAGLQKLVLVVSSLVFVFLILEGGFRFRNLISPRPQGIPTPSGNIFEWRYHKSNSLGFRDQEPSQEKGKNTFRIVCIGDSYTEGVGIREEDRYTEVLERELQKRFRDIRIEVINAGMGDTHTEDHIRFLRRMLEFSPDFVLLAYVFNDIEHVEPPVRWTKMNPVRRVVLSRIVENSHLGADLVARLRTLGFLRYESGIKASPYFDDATMTAHLAAIREFFEICADSQVPAVLAPFDVSFSLDTAIGERYDRLCRLVAGEGIEVWRLDHLFRDRPFEELKVSPMDGHPNAYAHEVVGKELAQRVFGVIDKSR